MPAKATQVRSTNEDVLASLALCPIARTTNLLGDQWTPIIMREFLAGPRRFDALQARLGISRATLAKRLDRLVDDDLLAKRQYSNKPPRFEYELTEKGLAFWDILLIMWRFGEDWLFGQSGPPVALKDRETARRVRPMVIDEASSKPIMVQELRMGRASHRDQLK